MAKPRGRLVEETARARSNERRGPAYRAVTLGTRRDDWAVYDAHGNLVFRGAALEAAVVANWLTPADEI